jgi:ABC-2 type transport system permease protein
MNTLRKVARRELAVFFASPAAFIFFGAFLAATLFIFFWVETFSAAISPMSGRCLSGCRCC